MTQHAQTLRTRAHNGRSSLVLVEPSVAVHPRWLQKHNRRSEKALRRHESTARWRDVAVVGVTAPIWLPLIALIACLVKAQDLSAPVLFKQKRTGRDGRRIDVLKFRTMVKDADAMKQSLMHLNELQWPDFKITNDPRVTKLGRILRATSLDELPQLLNVLVGDMGLVGPRPTSFDVDTYDVWHTARLDVRPGITGLWQVAARADLEWDQRVRLELAYSDRASSLLDLEILLRTVGAVFNRSGR